MSLTIGEANAVFHLLDYVLDEPGPAGPLTSDNALKAALLLRDKAHKTLTAGMPPDRLHALWAVYAERIELERNGVASCVLCGCIEDHACEGGCAWMPNPFGVDLCTACVELLAGLLAEAPAPAEVRA
ncbi:hypothetical protein HD597_011273 [Nonomuraea thailandensis]|uniref:Uncharacterized protein n=1 Tax=Nonomuraea thailandensis TaxID=1188745 RepID=A0A9X2K8K9_9ACTN|nr:hypothetical protein [Nonomuraea thailandensis]MCP2364253.1 hypothetical protein [Nonomuraea thailandensis]